MKRSIDILAPSRGRPDRFKAMAHSAIEKASDPDRVTIWLLVDDDDPALAVYRRQMLKGVRIVVETVRRGCPGHLDELALFHSTGQLLMAGSDDIVFRSRGWDRAFDAAFDACPDQLQVAYTNDGRDRDKCEHFVVSRRWVELVGHFMWPGFEHFCGDAWVEDIGKRVGRLRFLKDVTTEHRHFKYGKAERDPSYAAKRNADGEGRSMSDRDVERMGKTETLRIAAAQRIREAMAA